MNIKSREETIEALKIIRAAVCSYGAPYGRRCDCKYGVTAETFGKGSERGPGCPELYSAIELLKADAQEIERLRAVTSAFVFNKLEETLKAENERLQGELEEAREDADTFYSDMNRIVPQLTIERDTLQQQNAELREGLGWLIQHTIDDTRADEDGTPDHICEFATNPCKGACDFHEKWWGVYFLVWDECSGPLAPCDKCEGPCPQPNQPSDVIQPKKEEDRPPCPLCGTEGKGRYVEDCMMCEHTGQRFDARGFWDRCKYCLGEHKPKKEECPEKPGGNDE